MDATVINVIDPATFVSAAKYTNIDKIDLNGVLQYNGSTIKNQYSLTTNAAFVEYVLPLLKNMPENADARGNGSVVLAIEIVSFDIADGKVRFTDTNVIKEIDGVKVVIDVIRQAKDAGTDANGNKKKEEQRIIAEFKVPGGTTFKGNFPAKVGVLAAQSTDGTVNVLIEANHSKNPRFPINVWANPA